VADQPGIPVFMRIGDNEEHHLGDLHTRDAMPALLRHAADQFERGLAVPDPTTDEEH
jgi:hypothetical protein